MELKPDLVLRHAPAGQAHPVDLLLDFLDMLFGCATLIVEVDNPVRVHRQIGHDKADAREQLAGMPFNLGDDAAWLVPRRRLILEVTVNAPHMIGRTSDRALEQMTAKAVSNLS